MLGLIQRNFLFKKKIIKRDEDGQDYMVRYTLCNNSLFSIKVHNLLISDNIRCLHDHPWLFYSLILKGGYWEHTPNANQHKIDLTEKFDGDESKTVKKWLAPGSLLRRPAHWIHALELPLGQTCWTLVITFKKTRDWGFYTKAWGFLNWKEYRAEHC